MKKLTPKEQAFVLAFMGEARGNATRAAQLAGYGRTKKSQAQIGWRLLRKVEIGRALAAVNEKKAQTSIATAQELDEIVSTIARDVNGERFARLRAADILNKTSGRYSSLLKLEGRMTLEEALGQARSGKTLLTAEPDSK